MTEQIDNKEVKEGGWDSWTEEEERNFVLAFLIFYIGFFLVFVSLVALFGK
jgi:hypothetical protein